MTNDSKHGLRTYAGGVALITGGASGIGAAIGRALVDQGARVVLADRQEDLAKALAERWGENARATALDVRDPAAFSAIAKGIKEREGRLDYFFNNAGIGMGGLFEDHSLEDWRYIVDVNLMGVVHGISSIYPILLDQGFGHIVNTASMAGRMATPGLSAYSATKHAVVGLSRALRAEAMGRGVRVSCFCPGVIRTEILEAGGVFGKFVSSEPRQLSADQFERARPMPADAFARAALRRVAANDEIIILPRLWRILDWLDRVLPPALRGLMTRQVLAQVDRITQGQVIKK